MTQEERDLIARFVARVGGGQAQGGGFIGGPGSVPQTQAALPPIDREADAFIAEQFQRYPEARYRITQVAVVQEAALAEMNNRMTRMQAELEQARQQAQQPQSKGLFGSLFGGGGGQTQPQPPRGGPWGQQGYGQQGYAPQYQPQPGQMPPQYQQGMFGRGGSGFLGSALTTAAGVAGGMVVGNALMNAFGGHGGEAQAAGGLFGGGQPGALGTDAFDGGGVVPGGDPTAGFDQASGGYDAGGGGFDGGGGGGFDAGGGGGFDAGGGGGFDGGGGGFDNA